MKNPTPSDLHELEELTEPCEPLQNLSKKLKWEAGSIVIRFYEHLTS